MPKSKQQKQEIINDLQKKLAKNKSVVLLGFDKVGSLALFDLRDKIKEAGAELKVVKKTLLEKALAKKQEGIGQKIQEIKSQLALVFGFEDELTPAKICYDFSKTQESLKILGSILEGGFAESAKMIELAQLPSRDELLAWLAGCLKAPINNFTYALKGNLNNLVYTLEQISKVKQ